MFLVMTDIKGRNMSSKINEIMLFQVFWSFWKWTHVSLEFCVNSLYCETEGWSYMIRIAILVVTFLSYFNVFSSSISFNMISNTAEKLHRNNGQSLRGSRRVPHWQRSCRLPLMNRLKFKVKVKVTLEQATKAQRGNRCTALLFLQPRL